MGSPHSIVRTAAHAYDRPAPGQKRRSSAAAPPRFRRILPAKAGNSSFQNRPRLRNILSGLPLLAAVTAVTAVAAVIIIVIKRSRSE